MDASNERWINKRSIHASQEYAPRLFRENRDLACLSWFPHYYFNQVFNDIPAHDILPRETGCDAGFLFFDPAFFVLDPNFNIAFVSLIRAAWTTLRANPGQLQDVLEPLLLDDMPYLTYLHESSGLSEYQNVSKEVKHAH